MTTILLVLLVGGGILAIAWVLFFFLAGACFAGASSAVRIVASEAEDSGVGRFFTQLLGVAMLAALTYWLYCYVKDLGALPWHSL